MSISKSQLDAINSGVLDTIGDIDSPDLADEGALDKMLFNIAKQLSDDLRKSATSKGVVATKELRSSIDPTQVKPIPDGLEVSIIMSPQWKYAEKGRKSGKRPPIRPIEEWITAKGIQPKPKKGQTTLEWRKSLAFAISRKIGKSGTIKRFQYKGSRFIAEVLTPDYIAIIANHLAEMQGKKIQLYFTLDSQKT